MKIVETKMGECDECKQTSDKLMQCSRCKMTVYCSAECQRAAYAQHKTLCRKVADASVELDRNERELRAMEPDGFSLPADVFTNGVGHFWGILDTRDYMRARGQVVRWLHQMGTPRSLKACLDHVLDCLRLCRSDNMGLRDPVVFVMLLLERWQHCYDFVKWWATCDPDGRYDWGDVTLPYLSIKDADMLEPVDYMLKRHGSSLCHTVGMLLLKHQLLKQTESLDASVDVLNQRLPVELTEMIREKAFNIPTLVTSIQKLGGLTKARQTLQNHVEQLLKQVHGMNSHFLKGVLDPRPLENFGEPQYYSSGDITEAVMVWSYSKQVFNDERFSGIKTDIQRFLDTK